MEFISVILFKGQQAHYSVNTLDGQSFKANLIKYLGNSVHTPPNELNGLKDGRHWSGNEEYQDIMDDIGFEVKEKYAIDEDE